MGDKYSDLIPSNWGDPILTGEDAVLPRGFEFTPQDIENLLEAIKARIVEKEQAGLKQSTE